MGLAGLLPAATDDAWAQGRPAETLPALVAEAERTATWHAWQDAALCAAAAGERGQAAAYLMEARRRAPGRDEPRQAMAVLGIAGPVLLTDRIGPIAIPGSGWAGVAVLLIAGLAIGAWIMPWRGPRQVWLPVVAVVALLLAGPGVVAAWIDAADRHAATIHDTQLLDATGAPVTALTAGTVVEVVGPAWSHRLPVRLEDGRSGFIPAGDLR